MQCNGMGYACVAEDVANHSHLKLVPYELSHRLDIFNIYRYRAYENPSYPHFEFLYLMTLTFTLILFIYLSIAFLN